MGKLARGDTIMSTEFVSVSEPIRSWREEEDGVIYFSVTSDGTTGLEWIERLEKKGFCLLDYVKSILRSPDFRPTSSVMTEVAVLKGMLFEDQSRTTKNIRIEAKKRKLSKLNAELACLILDKFTDEEIEAMGLNWIVAVHEPINDTGGAPSLLNVGRNGDCRFLSEYYGRSDGGWPRDFGFAFAVSPV